MADSRPDKDRDNKKKKEDDIQEGSDISMKALDEVLMELQDATTEEFKQKNKADANDSPKKEGGHPEETAGNSAAKAVAVVETKDVVDYDQIAKVLKDTLDELKGKSAEMLTKLRTTEISGDPQKQFLQNVANMLTPESLNSLKILTSRIPCSQPLLPENATSSWSKNIRLACWNIGAKSKVDEAILLILMQVHQIDVFFLQETQCIQFDSLEGIENYGMHYIPSDDANNRGVYILYKKEMMSAECVSNPGGKLGGACRHRTNSSAGVKIYSDGNDIEHVNLDISLHSTIRRFINLYHASPNYAQQNMCPGNIVAHLQPHLTNDMEQLLAGDGNIVEYTSAKNPKNKKGFGDSMKKYGMRNCLPPYWDTRRSNKKNGTQPDIVFSSIHPTDIVVHKPIPPFALLDAVLDEKLHVEANVLRKVRSLLMEVTTKEVNNSDDYRRRDEYHKIIIMEIGEDVNTGDHDWCSPEDSDLGDGKVYHCKMLCKFHELLDGKRLEEHIPKYKSTATPESTPTSSMHSAQSSPAVFESTPTSSRQVGRLSGSAASTLSSDARPAQSSPASVGSTSAQSPGQAPFTPAGSVPSPAQPPSGQQ